MNVAFRSLDELELRMEFGDRVDLTANSRVLALDRALTETAAPCVRKTAHSGIRLADVCPIDDDVELA